VTEFVLNNFPFQISIDPYASSGIFAFLHKENKSMVSIPVSESQHGPVSIVTTLWAGRLGNLGMIPHRCRAQAHTSSEFQPHFCPVDMEAFSSVVIRWSVQLTTNFHLVPWLRSSGSISTFLHIFSW
jgi:hypothetical protein